MSQPPPVRAEVDQAVAVDGLVERYGELEAVRGISFEVPTGETFGRGSGGRGLRADIGASPHERRRRPGRSAPSDPGLPFIGWLASRV